MWVRSGVWLSVLAGIALLAAAGWMLVEPAPPGGDLALRDVLASEQSARWAILGVLGALLGNILLFLNLRIAAQATDAAKVAADAALEAVNHARETSALELRPYVENIYVNFNRDEDQGRLTAVSVRLTWRNIGKTPARNVRTFIGWAAGPKDRDWSDFDFPERPQWVNDSGQIGPESEMFSYSWFKIPVEELVAVQRGEKSVVFYGSIEYDGLSADQRHRTEVSAAFVINDDPTDPSSQYGHRFLGCHHGFDGDCLYKPRRKPAVSQPKGFAPQLSSGA